MADNFNMKKFLTENKLGPYAKLKEEKSNKQKLIDAGYSESDAEDFADEFEQGGSKVPQKVKDILDNKKSENIEEIDNAIYASLDDPDPDRRGDAERTGAEYIKLSDPRNPQHREWMRSKSSSSTKSSPLDKIVSRLRMIYRHRIDAFQYKPAQRQSAIETIVKAVEDELAKSTIQNKEGAKFVILKKLLGHVPFDYKKFLPSQTPTRQKTGDPEVDFLGEGLSFQVMDRIEGLVNEKMLQTALMALGEVITDLENEGIDYDDALAYVQLAIKEYLGAF